MKDAAAALSGAEWAISADGHEAVVVEVGGGLRAYRHNGTDYLDGWEPGGLCPASAGKVMAPWPNRVRDGRYSFDGQEHQLPVTEVARHNAIHGLVSWVRWTPEVIRPEVLVLDHDLVPQPGYPFPLGLRTHYHVGPEGLTVTHGVTNHGDRPAPFGLATHPYLLVPGVAVDDVVLTVPGQSRVLVDGRLLPIGTAKVAGTEFDYTSGRRIGAAQLDVAFGDLIDHDGRTTVTLRGPDGAGVAVWADGSYRWWQVFTGDTLGPPRTRRSVAVEPMTCPPDALRSGKDLVVLQPGEDWRGSWGITPVAA